MISDDPIRREAKAAEARIEKHALKQEKKKLRKLQRATDGFFVKLLECLDKDGKATYSLDEKKDYFYNSKEKKHELNEGTPAAYLAAKCRELGLKVTVHVESEQIEYRCYTTAGLIVTR